MFIVFPLAVTLGLFNDLGFATRRLCYYLAFTNWIIDSKRMKFDLNGFIPSAVDRCSVPRIFS